MPRRFLEVEHLRIAVEDVHAANSRGGQPPSSVHGDRLSEGWVEAIPGATYGVGTGETLAIIGESASGKSLMLLGAFGLLPAGCRVLGGTTTYRGLRFEPGGSREDPERPIRRKERRLLQRSGTVTDEADPEWARIVGSEIGFLFQNPISSWTPILEIGPQAGEALATHTDLTDDEIRERVLDALGEVRLPKSNRMMRAFSSQLSRGMGQRAMLAAALVKAPRLLIADEPLSGLDVSVSAAILDLIKDLNERRGMAMVIVTHDLAVVARVADRVAVVYGGRIAEEGPIGETFRRPQHPYTSGLLGSIPALTSNRLRPIPGEQPPLAEIPGRRCAFAPRCAYASDVCHTVEPRMQTTPHGGVACHHAAEISLPGIG